MSHTQSRMNNNRTGPVADIREEAVRIIEAAHIEGIPLRLLGGVAISLQCPSTSSNEQLRRPYKDLDFVTLSKWRAKTKALFTSLGYEGNKTFNALHGYQRLLFWDQQLRRRVDIFIDGMRMCHTLDFRSRLDVDQRTLSLSDLLLTKLQILEINEKDLYDIIALFHNYDVVDNERGIYADYIVGLVSSDWGLYKTLKLNLEKTRAFAIAYSFPSYISKRIDALVAAMEARPKSLGWKVRAKVGERVRWYELPDEERQ